MASEHIIHLIRLTCNNLDDLKKIQTAVEASIESIEFSLELINKETPTPEPPTLKQIQAQN